MSGLFTLHDSLSVLAVYLTGDEVIAATRDTMEETIKYIMDKYGTVDKYLQTVCTSCPTRLSCIWYLCMLQQNCFFCQLPSFAVMTANGITVHWRRIPVWSLARLAAYMNRGSALAWLILLKSSI